MQIKEHIGDDDVIHGKRLLSCEPQTMEFAVKTGGLERTFYTKVDSGELEEIATLKNVYYLCDEGLKRGKRFTGAMLGVFAYAGLQDFTADFSGFTYIPER